MTKKLKSEKIHKMQPIIYLVVFSAPFIAGCQKTSEKFGYDPPDEWTTHDNGIRESNRWIPCTEVCLAKEIPRIRNAVLDVQNVSRIEFENLKKQFQEFRDLEDQRWKKLQEQMSKVGGLEREINLGEDDLLCSPQPKESRCNDCDDCKGCNDCKNALKTKKKEEKDSYFAVETLPAFIGFSRPNRLLKVTKVSITFGEPGKPRRPEPKDPEHYHLIRFLSSNDSNCADSLNTDGQVSWEVEEWETSYFRGIREERSLSAFGRQYAHCFGIQIMERSPRLVPIKISGFKVIGEEMPDP